MALKSKPLEAVRADVPVKEAASEEKVRINLEVPRSLRQRLKALAAARETTVTDLVLEALLGAYELKRPGRPPARS